MGGGWLIEVEWRRVQFDGGVAQGVSQGVQRLDTSSRRLRGETELWVWWGVVDIAQTNNPLGKTAIPDFPVSAQVSVQPTHGDNRPYVADHDVDGKILAQ